MRVTIVQGKLKSLLTLKVKKAKTDVFASISPTQLMDPTFHAPCTVGKVEAQVVAVAPLVRDDVADVGALVQRMAQMQQEAMQGQFQLQQNFFEQFIRMLPGILPSNAAASERVHELPVQLTTAVPSTPVDSSGLTIGEWEQAVLKPPILEATKLDDEANKYYVKVSRKFEDCIYKFQNSEKNLVKVRADINEMRDDSSKWRYPPGTRPWKAPGDAVQLDESWIPSRESDYNITVCVPKGSSRRDALQWLHHGMEMARKDIHAEALAEYVSCLKPMTTRSAFFQGCANFRSESLEALNLEDGKQFTANGKLALKRCEDLYTNVIDKVRKRHQLDKQSAEEKEKEKKKKRKLLKSWIPKRH
jgi:hypothetical protein